MKTKTKQPVTLSDESIEEIQEIKREFQVERMVLFSDAVFAIVITLMAIEIRLPETDVKMTSDQFLTGVVHLLPVIGAYIVSFFFIGMTWYRHLKLFAKVKFYDGGLVVRNLILLGFIGLFPFSASLITHASSIVGPYFIYFMVAVLCTVSQQLLQHYLIVTKPELLTEPPAAIEIKRVKADAIQTVALLICAVLTLVTFHFIKDPESKPFAMLLLLPILLVKVYLKKRNA